MAPGRAERHPVLKQIDRRSDETMVDQRLLTHEQAAERLGVSVGTLRALVRDGVLADLRVGRHHRVLAQEVECLRDAGEPLNRT